MTDETQKITRAQRVKEFCETFQICEATFWKYAALGSLKTIKIGRRVLVPGVEVDRVMREGIKAPAKVA